MDLISASCDALSFFSGTASSSLGGYTHSMSSLISAGLANL